MEMKYDCRQKWVENIDQMFQETMHKSALK
jgi:hypothetical protein